MGMTAKNILCCCCWILWISWYSFWTSRKLFTGIFQSGNVLKYERTSCSSKAVPVSY